MSGVTERLGELGLTLPSPKEAVANYVGCKQAGDLLFVSALVSEVCGAAGSDVSTDDAYQAARCTMLGLLAIVKAHLGDLDRVAWVVKVNGFVRSSPDFTEQPRVVDGASDLLVELFGDAGRHARTATGVAQLPFGATVQLEMQLQL